MNSKVMIEYNGSQIGSLVQSDLIMLSNAQVLLSNIDIPLPLKDN